MNHGNIEYGLMAALISIVALTLMGKGHGAHLPWLPMHCRNSAIVAIVMNKVNERFIDLFLLEIGKID